MASKLTDCIKYRWFGQHAPPTSASQQPFLAGITGAGGTVAVQSGGFLRLAFDDTNEAANIRVHMGDKLAFLRGDLIAVEFLIRVSDAALAANVSVAFGMGSAYNADPDALAASAMIRSLAGASNAIIVESDDGVTDVDDVATGEKLLTTWQRFRLEFATDIKSVAAPGVSVGGLVNFRVGDALGSLTRVGSNKQFDLSGYALGLQPIIQIAKASSTNTGHLDLKAIDVEVKMN